MGQAYPPLLQGTGQFVSAGQPVSGFIAGPQTGSIYQAPMLVQVPVQQSATLVAPGNIMAPSAIFSPSVAVGPSTFVAPALDVAIDSPIYAVQPAAQTVVQETVTNNFVQTPPLPPKFEENLHIVAEAIDTQRLFTRPIVVERPVRSTIEQVPVPGFVAKTVTTPSTIKRTVTTVEKKLVPLPTAPVQVAPVPFDFCRALLLGLLALLLLAGLLWGLTALFRRPAPVVTKPLPPPPAPTVLTLTKEQRRICRIVDSSSAATVTTGIFGRKTKKIIGTTTSVHPGVLTGPRKFKLGRGEYADAHGIVYRKVTSKVVVPHGAQHENYSTGVYAPLRAISPDERLEYLPAGVYFFEGTDTEFYVTDCEEIYIPPPVIVPPPVIIPPPPVIVKPPPPPPLVVIPPPTIIQPEPIYDLIIETPPTLTTVTNVTTIPYNIVQELLTTPPQTTVVISGVSTPVSYDFTSQKIIFDAPRIGQTTFSTSPAALITQPAEFVQTSPVAVTSQTIQQGSPQVNFVTQTFDPTFQNSDLAPELASQYYNQLLAESQQFAQSQQQMANEFIPAELQQLPPEVLAQLLQVIQEQQANGQQVSLDQLGNLIGFNAAHSASSKLPEETATVDKI